VSYNRFRPTVRMGDFSIASLRRFCSWPGFSAMPLQFNENHANTFIGNPFPLAKRVAPRMVLNIRVLTVAPFSGAKHIMLVVIC